MKLAVGVMCLGALLAAVAGPAAARHASTVPLNVTHRATWNPSGPCPPGVPRKVGGSFSKCYLISSSSTFQGLGKVTVRQNVGFLNDRTKCMTIKSKIVLAVGTKGHVHATGQTKRCVDPNEKVTVVPFKITGGTGAFTTATGGGTITVTDARETGRGVGDQKELWKGTLTFSE